MLHTVISTLTLTGKKHPFPLQLVKHWKQNQRDITKSNRIIVLSTLNFANKNGYVLLL